MDILDNQAIKAFDLKKSAEVEHDIRKEIQMIRLNAFKNSDSKNGTSKVRHLRKFLARVKTHQTVLTQSNKHQG